MIAPYKTFRDAITNAVSAPRIRKSAGQPISSPEYFWALKDVSFEAHDGDRIALIGNNGSGKSTLLRLLSDVYPASTGRVKVVGEVSPMFDPAKLHDSDRPNAAGGRKKPRPSAAIETMPKWTGSTWSCSAVG